MFGIVEVLMSSLPLKSYSTWELDIYERPNRLQKTQIEQITEPDGWSTKAASMNNYTRMSF